MEENKSFDINSLIGFLLIGGIILYMLNMNQDDEVEKDEDNQAKTESVEEDSSNGPNITSNDDSLSTSSPTKIDSAAQARENEKLGAFSYSAGLSSAKDETTTIENEVLKLKVSNKGGQIIEAYLKKMVRHDSTELYLIKDGNASFGLSFLTTTNKSINTKNLYFKPEVTKNGENTILSMRLKAGEDKYLEYIYTLKPEEYMLDFVVKSRSLNDVINQAQDPELNWKLDGFRHDKSISFENRYTENVWHYKDNKNSSRQSDGDDEAEDVNWIAYRQHFFSSILLTDSPFKEAKMELEDISDDSDDSVYSKSFSTTIPLKLSGGELNQDMNFYFGPSDIKELNKYDRDLNEIIPMGWGIFGWINHYVFLPMLNFFMQHLPAGLAIILLTIIVKLLLSPVQYKQFLSQAKQRVLRPEVDEINEKYKDNQMKRQKKTMELNRKAGINPASGCLVGIIQIPIFIALFRLFPSIFSLRHKSFLWANDLSSYDVIAELPFKIPFYGDHVSLFPLLASAAIFVYMTLNMSAQNMPKQPGMPNMKYIMYISPVFMLFFFNTYPSALSVYYLTSNLISIAIVLVIKIYILDEDKIHNKIQANKKKPRKQNRFQRKMGEMMEQAEQQKKK